MTDPQNIQTIEIEKGRVFISGLFWQTLSSPKDIKKEVLKLANELDFNLLVTREGLLPQVGFASTGDGASEGYISCAAVVSKHYEETGDGEFGGMLCASILPDGRYLLVAMRDGAILPDGDIIDSENEIESRYTQLMSISAADWGIRVAPASWGIENSVERDFLSYLPRKKNNSIDYHSWWEIRSLADSKKRAAKRVMVMAGIVAMIMIGAIGFKQYQKYKAKKTDEARQSALNSAQQSALSNLHVVIPTPWKESPPPALVLMACESYFSPKYLFAGGWNIKSFSCSPTAVNFIWYRGSASFPSLKNLVPSAIPDEMEENAAASVLFSFAHQVDSDIGNIADVRTAFLRRMQSLGTNILLTKTPVVLARPPGAPADFVMPEPGYEAYQWEIPGTVLRPNTMSGLIDKNSMRISAISLKKIDSGSIEWSYKGEMYGKN